VAIGLVQGAKLRAQTAGGAGETFEVASIRPADPDSRQAGFGLTPGGGINVLNMDVKSLIAFAYNVACGKNCDMFISGGPSWLGSSRFNIQAKGNDSSDLTAGMRERIRQRLRSLLAERFQLVLRRESKEMPVYALKIAKDGHKLKTPKVQGEQGGIRGERGQMIGENAPLNFLIVNITGQLGRPVIDQTGLTGRFDFTLEFTPDMRGGKGPDVPGDKGDVPSASEPSGPSIFTAIQEQLGLKLEAAREPVETFVIERIEKPTEN
jgi:uncharacterized protein (TIGR03435 family)